MVEIRTSDADRFLRKPDPKTPVFLIYGPDEGMVSERATQLTDSLRKAVGGDVDVIRIDDADLAADPDRLNIELGTISMFGGHKLIRLRGLLRFSEARLAELLREGMSGATLIMEAGNLKKTSKHRQHVAKASNAAAIACFPDEGRGIDTLISEVVSAAGMRIANDARQALASRLGADRALSRSEIEKLTLYARGAGEITTEHVAAAVGDATEHAIDDIVNLVCSGQIRPALASMDRAMTSGQTAQTILLALQRHLLRLEGLVAAVAAGQGAEAAVKSLRPPLHFRAQDAIKSQLRTWTNDTVVQAIRLTYDVIGQSRLTSALERELTEQLFMRVARLAGGRPRR